jgi:two-component system nitrogen regulation response regulator GlnG
MPTLLVVDDEPAIQHAFQRAYRGRDLVLRSAATATEAVAQVERERPDAIVLDVRLPDASGLDTYHRIRAVDARIPVILVTGHGTADLAIEAMKEGAWEYLLKPLELGQLRDVIDRALRSSRLMRTPAEVAEGEPATTKSDLLVGRCPAIQEVYKAIGRVARQNITTLILGESGTGKELVARAIYQHSDRANHPFLAINCGAIPENLLESELFGHEKGAFTGADRRRIGKFEQCHGGTIFLDEIGELTPLAQVKLLRLLQDQQFERVGGDEVIRTDVRILAATNADLERAAEDGRFRKDLYFRLNGFTLRLPPLRERGDDLRLLIDHYLRRFSQELGRDAVEIAPEAMDLLKGYSWPGNVRELQSVLRHAILHTPGSTILPESLPTQLTNHASPPPAAGDFSWDDFVNERIAQGTTSLYAESVERLEREVLVRVLRHTAGNQLQAAKILGITRGSLRNKIRLLGITIGREVWSEDEQGDS